MTVSDVWKLAQFHKVISNAKDDDGKPVIGIKKFGGKISRQLITITERLALS
jgi:hypothetical protein